MAEIAEWFRLRSNNILAISWNAKTKLLTVVFLNSQEKKYLYERVGIEVYFGLKYSDAPGAYLSRSIKGHYSFTTEKTTMEERVAFLAAPLVITAMPG